jgi:hypothetical protein
MKMILSHEPGDPFRSIIIHLEIFLKFCPKKGCNSSSSLILKVPPKNFSNPPILAGRNEAVPGDGIFAYLLRGYEGGKGR